MKVLSTVCNPEQTKGTTSRACLIDPGEAAFLQLRYFLQSFISPAQFNTDLTRTQSYASIFKEELTEQVLVYLSARHSSAEV